jgi:hypothetical protein
MGMSFSPKHTWEKQMSSRPHSIRYDTIAEFKSTGFWTGFRIFLIPALLLAGYTMYGEQAKASLANHIDGIIAPISRAASLPNGSYAPIKNIFTPNPGAKWVRP